jgi:dUTP pyrophosphatase
MPKDVYLELTSRSSVPLKNWLVLANGVGVIDADYYNNEDNEGEIFLQFINLSPCSILIKEGDKIGQGIFHKYLVTANEEETKAKRTGGFGSTT